MKKRICIVTTSIMMLLFMGTAVMTAQVTIGADQYPSSFSVLELISNNSKGLRLPQMTTDQRESITDDAFKENPLAHGLHIYNTETECEEYWNGEEWKSLCGSPGKAKLTVECSEITVNSPSKYFNGRDLTGEHFLEIIVNVEKPGTYYFTALPKTANGYYFEKTGEFLESGTYMLKMQGAGKPINFTVPEGDLTKGDTITIANYGNKFCEKVIHINNGAQPEYTMQCGTAKYTGRYELDKPLDNSHTIVVTINVSAVNPGAVAVLETDEVDGIKFISNPTPIIANGTMQVTLYGEGKPSAAGAKTFTISSNSMTSNSTCHININMSAKKKRFLVYGTAPYAFTSGNANSAYAFVKDERNFGSLPNSIVQIEEIEIISGGAGLISPVALAAHLDASNPHRPDAVFLFYHTGWTSADADAIATTLTDYLNEGKPVLWFNDNTHEPSGTGAPARTTKAVLLNRVFNTTGITLDFTETAADAVFMFENINHPVLNGPFGDVRGKYWGDDASYSMIAQNLPVNDISIFSNSYDWSRNELSSGLEGYTNFMHRTKPFLYVADGGFLSSIPDNPPLCCHPFRLDANNFPTVKPRHGVSEQVALPVHNSTFFGNLLAWVIKYVEGVEQ